MPTAARLVAAIALAIAAYGVSTVLLYVSEPLQKTGVSHVFFGLVGFVVGWKKLGPLAERGYVGAWSGGITAAVNVYVFCVVIAACHYVYLGFFYHAFRTVDELLDSWFTKAIEYAMYITQWEILTAAIFGGMLAGTFSAMAGRLWR